MTPYHMTLRFGEDSGVWHLEIFNLNEEEPRFVATYTEWDEAEEYANFMQSITGLVWEKV